MTDDVAQIKPFHTDDAPQPAGTYSQAVLANGFIFLSGQTPRRPDGERLGDRSFEEQAAQVLANLAAVAQASGTSLEQAVKVTVFLADGALGARFDEIYREFVGTTPPARTLVQSNLPGFSIEVDAILQA